MNADWLSVPSAPLNETARREAESRQAILTKPPGALGSLEVLAVRLAAMQGASRPQLDRVSIAVFAADHGVAAEGVSAFPQSVTVEMVRNFARGGAAICVLARQLGAALEVLNLGTVNDPGPLNGVLNLRLGPGTANFTQGAAMTEEQLVRAIHAGRHSAERAKLAGAQLYIGGEMGIGNTTAAAALACALLGAEASTPGMEAAPGHPGPHAALLRPWRAEVEQRWEQLPTALAGPGTGLNAQGVIHKAEVIRRALALHREHLADPLEALRRLGGFEIAALAGSFIACAQMGLTVLVDGFIASVAALVAARRCPGTNDWFIYAHASAEPGHACVLTALDARPLLDLGMRLGEGSGAATAVPLLRLACALHNEMATFAEAGVSGKDSR